jgi:hypothetical protein
MVPLKVSLWSDNQMNFDEIKVAFESGKKVHYGQEGHIVDNIFSFPDGPHLIRAKKGEHVLAFVFHNTITLDGRADKLFIGEDNASQGK